MKIPPEVLEVLDNVQVRTDGPLLRLPFELHRPLYDKVNRVLIAAGGRWDGSKEARGHRFDRPADQVLAQLRTGVFITAREKGFIPTPPEIAETLVSYVNVGPGSTVLEPSAGTGALVHALVPYGATVHLVESDPDHRPALEALLRDGYAVELHIGDFLSMPAPDPSALFDLNGATQLYDAIVMNPPFHSQVHHLLHAWDWLAPGGELAAIVSAGITFRQDRHHDRLRALIIEHGRVVDRLPQDAFAASGVDVHTVIVRLSKPKLS
ncbi:hypothetical protein [Nocardiopsis synnemataformans]|uniref:hypothetical protein n=1 Tax=Nocardiopsis synnemataformans TaxID=61305 RepID=UPI003EB7C6F7